MMKTLNAIWKSLGGWDKLGDYIVALIIVLVGYVLARSVAAAIQRIGGRQQPNHSALVGAKFARYGLLILSVILALNQVGIKLTGLLAAAGIATVAISFAAQTSVSNIISGIFLLFDRPFSIGETIKVDTTLGVVLSVGLLSSKMRTFDNLVVRIPNEALLKSTIVNYSLMQVRRVDLALLIALDADLIQAQRVVLDAMRAHRLVLDEPPPFIVVDEIRESGVLFQARAWALSSDYIQARSALNCAIVDALRRAQIEIPLPQRVVTLRHGPQGEGAGAGSGVTGADPSSAAPEGAGTGTMITSSITSTSSSSSPATSTGAVASGKT